MAITSGSSVKKGSASQQASAGIDTSNCPLKVAIVVSDTNPPSFTDSCTETWLRIGAVQAAAFGTSYSSLHWVANATNGVAGNTFTPGPGTTGLCVMAFHGTGPFTLTANSEAGAQASTARAGSITPTTDNQIVVFGAGGWDTDGTTQDVTAEVEDLFAVSALNYACTIGYVIQTTAASANPGVTGTFTWGVHTAAFAEATARLAPSRFARQAVNRASTY